MSWASGEKLSKVRMQRLSESIPSSYTVWKDGTNYRAETNISGGTDYGPLPDPTTVIQAAIDAVPNGGKVFIKKAATNYVLTQPLSVTTEDLSIDSDWGTLDGFGFMVQASNFNIHNLYVKNAAYGVRVDGDAAHVRYYPKILDCFFDTCSKAVSLEFTSQPWMQNCIVYNSGYGVYVRDYGNDGWITDNIFCYGPAAQTACIYIELGATHITEGLRLTSNNLLSNSGYGIYAAGANFLKIFDNLITTKKSGIYTTDDYMSQTQIEHNVLDGILSLDESGINLGSHEWLWIKDNTIYDWHRHGIAFRAGGIVYATKVWIADNKFSGNNRSAGVYDDIFLDSVLATRIIGNDFHSTDVTMHMREVAGVATPTGYAELNRFLSSTKLTVLGGIKYAKNINYVTESNGTETGNGAQQTIHHLCNFTPTYDQVFLSERSTGGALAYQSAAPDADHIYVTAVNAKTYNWRVEG